MPKFPVWVIGLGSDHSDDRVGWEVIDRLQAMQLNGIVLYKTSDPLRLTEITAGCGLLVVVDACRGAGVPGSTHRFAWPDPRIAATQSVSTHGIGLATALQLAEALGKLPPRVVVLAVEAESGEPGELLNPAVAAAISEVIALLLAETAMANGATNE